MKVKITKLGKQDAFYPDRKKIIGLVGELESACQFGIWTGGYFYGEDTEEIKRRFISEYVDDFFCFAYVKFEEVK